jgi:exopolyphosphatase/pppGpp-phosphohydrolase
MDIGGRSTELIWVNNRDIKESNKHTNWSY